MAVFLSLFVFECADLYLYQYLKKIDNKKWVKAINIVLLILAVLLPLLIFGLRAVSVGTDTQEYLNVFEKIGNGSVEYFFRCEILYSLINLIIYKLTGNFTILLFVVGIIIATGFVYAIKNLSVNPLISVASLMGLGFYAQSLNIMRQYLALSMLLIGLVFLLKKNNNWLFLTFLLIATLFHKTACVGILFLLFKYLKCNYKTILVFVLISLLSIAFFPVFAKVFDALLHTSYYYNYAVFMKVNLDIKSIFFIIFSLATMVTIFIFRKKIRDKELNQTSKLYDFLIFSLITFILINFVSFFTISNVNRLGIYFSVLIIFIIPIILEYFKNKTKLCITICYMVGLMFFMYLVLGVAGSFQVVPYSII